MDNKEKIDTIDQEEVDNFRSGKYPKGSELFTIRGIVYRPGRYQDLILVDALDEDDNKRRLVFQRSEEKYNVVLHSLNDEDYLEVIRSYGSTHSGNNLKEDEAWAKNRFDLYLKIYKGQLAKYFGKLRLAAKQIRNEGISYSKEERKAIQLFYRSYFKIRLDVENTNALGR